jgi:predicted tellurium resistance membrane protein TerC
LAVKLLQLPFLKLIGGILLLWIGIKLLTEDDEHTDINGSDRLWGAVKTVIVADLVMSLDNVIAIAVPPSRRPVSTSCCWWCSASWSASPSSSGAVPWY